MENSLETVLRTLSPLLENSGFSIKISEGKMEGSYGASMDSSKYVGGICYWPDSTFEFQFNSCESGDVILLETKEFTQEKELELYIRELITQRLK